MEVGRTMNTLLDYKQIPDLDPLIVDSNLPTFQLFQPFFLCNTPCHLWCGGISFYRSRLEWLEG